MKPQINNPEKCIQCGACVRNCISECFQLEKKNLITDFTHCFACGSCVSVCPPGIIHFPDAGKTIITEKCFEEISLRRTCRFYKEEEIEKEVIEKLIDISAYTPTAKNIRRQKFYCLMGREKIYQLTGDILELFWKFRILRILVKIPLFREVLSRFELNEKNVYKTSRQLYKVRKRYREGKDPLFHNAPAVIIIISPDKVPLKAENASYAVSGIMTGAEKLGIGSCINGFAQIAFKMSSKLRKKYSIPSGHTVTGVLGLGYRKDKCLRVPERIKPFLKYF